MLTPRKIAVLQIFNGKLVKTRKFKRPQYIGDPLNAVRIFNEKEVDELIILDITPERRSKGPDFSIIKNLLSECQMPVGYGGGIQNLTQAQEIFRAGAEKVLINTLAFENPQEVRHITKTYGAQAVSLSVDYSTDFFGHFHFYKNGGGSKTSMALTSFIKLIGEISCGEVILHSISRDGTFKGFDYSLLKYFKDKITIPVVLLGGARNSNDLNEAVMMGAHSVAASSMFIYQGPHKAVLIQY